MSDRRANVEEPPPQASIPFSTPVGALFAAVMMGYAAWAAFTGHGRLTAVRVGYGPDSQYYIAAAKAPVWSMKFLATPNGAPFLFLLLAKLCLRNLRAIVLVQSAIAVGAWLFLADAVAAKLRAPVARWFAVIALLLLAISPPVLLWNATIATESLSVSLLCVAIALWIRLVGGGAARHDLLAFVVVLVALACTRDTNAYLLFVGSVVAVVVAFVRRDLHRRGLVIAAVCAIAGLGNIAASNHAGRWFDPLNETISVRLLGSPMATRYLVAHGLPLDANVRRLNAPHEYPFLRHSLLYAPEYKRYRTWVNGRGRSTYTAFLLTHPAWVVSRPFDDRDRLLAPVLRDYGWLFHDEPRGPFTVAGSIAFPGSPVLVEVWLALAAIAAAELWRRRRDAPLLIATGVVALLIVPHFLVVFHGDALEVDRHSLSAAVELRIVLWIITAMALDELLAHSAIGRVLPRLRRRSVEV
jgi:MYXO-CTERM domain-containing protein